MCPLLGSCPLPTPWWRVGGTLEIQCWCCAGAAQQYPKHWCAISTFLTTNAKHSTEGCQGKMSPISARPNRRCRSTSTLCQTQVTGKLQEPGLVGRRAMDVIHRCSCLWQLNHCVSYNFMQLRIQRSPTSSWPILYFYWSPSMALSLPCLSLACHRHWARNMEVDVLVLSPLCHIPSLNLHVWYSTQVASTSSSFSVFFLWSDTCLCLLFKVLPVCKNWHTFPLCHWENIFECQCRPPTW